jgi:hypothetical protein
MSPAVTSAAPDPPQPCAAGRELTHPDWPGWAEPCPRAGTKPVPPYRLCTEHDNDLAVRQQELL